MSLKIITTKQVVICDFCGLTEDEVPLIIAGPCVHICQACVRLCIDIVEDRHLQCINGNHPQKYQNYGAIQ